MKKKVGEKAAHYVEDGMLVGLGSGSTAECFIQSLALRCQEGLKVEAVSSSVRSEKLAASLGIHVHSMQGITSIDLTIDGADEVDPYKQLIKGGGGAHVREKIVATSSKKMIVIVDETKLVPILGKFGLPVEILSFGYESTLAKLNKLGFSGKTRLTKEGTPFVTDNGNYLYDIKSPSLFKEPSRAHEQLIGVTGVVDTGFFLDLNPLVIIGYADGRIETK